MPEAAVVALHRFKALEKRPRLPLVKNQDGPLTAWKFPVVSCIFLYNPVCIYTYSRANAPTGSAGEESVSSCWVAVAGFWWVLVLVFVVVVDDVVDVDVDVDVDVVVVVDVDVDVDVDVVVDDVVVVVAVVVVVVAVVV